MKKPNKKSENKINKLEEPTVTYNLDNNESVNSELHPILVQLIEKSKKELKEGKCISHEEAMIKFKENFPFLK